MRDKKNHFTKYKEHFQQFFHKLWTIVCGGSPEGHVFKLSSILNPQSSSSIHRPSTDCSSLCLSLMSYAACFRILVRPFPLNHIYSYIFPFPKHQSSLWVTNASCHSLTCILHAEKVNSIELQPPPNPPPYIVVISPLAIVYNRPSKCATNLLVEYGLEVIESSFLYLIDKWLFLVCWSCLLLTANV